MSLPISLLMQVATWNNTPPIEGSSNEKISSSQNLALPEINTKQNRTKYAFGWSDLRKIIKNDN